MKLPTSSSSSSRVSSLRPLAQSLVADGKFDIEFHGFLTNHVKHAIIALDRLEAPPARVQEYWDTYTTLTPYNLPIHRVEQPDWTQVPPVTHNEWKAYRGQKTHFQEQVAFLNQELHETFQDDTDALVAAYGTDILSGMVGALTHTIIHLGWAIDANSPWMITEGLAYLNFAHIGLDDEQLDWGGNGDSKNDNGLPDESTPMESLIRVAHTWEQENLKTNWIEHNQALYHDEKNFHPELVAAGFQHQVAKTLAQPHAVATQLPTWITNIGNNGSSSSSSSDEQLFESLYRATVYLYLASRDAQGHGNFVVLHLITSLWGLEKTLQAIRRASPTFDMTLTRKAIGHYYASLVCLLSTASGGFPSAQSLTEIQTKFPVDFVDAADKDWSDMVQAGIAEEEEHNIKLVYVMRELWHRYGYWAGFSQAAKSFTLTPDIGPSKPKFTPE